MFGFLIGFLISLVVFVLAGTLIEQTPYTQIAQSVGSLAVAISAVVALKLDNTTILRHQFEDQRNRSREYLSND